MNKTIKLNNSDDVIFTLTKDELSKFRDCYINSLQYIPLTCCFTLNRFTYENSWLNKFTQIIPMDCYGVYEQHEDTYIHFITKDNLAEVLESGLLKVSKYASEYYLGEGVYAFQVNSGKYFKGRDAIVFNTNLPHIHCFSDADACHFGEVLFEQDVKLNDVKVIPSGQVEDFIKKNYDCKYALEHDYGFNYTENVPLEDLYDFLVNNA